VLDVVQVELDPLAPGQRRAPVYLRPAGDAGADRQAAALSLAVLRYLHRDRRARADEGHIAAHDVEQIGQLVQRGAPKQRTHAGDARIVLVDRQSRADVLGPRDHRAQLQQVELAPAAADAPLPVDRVPRRLDPDRDHRHRHHRRCDHTGERPADDIDRAADQRVPSAACHDASVPWRSQSHRPAAGEATVST
jgi:hypothetical protein